MTVKLTSGRVGHTFNSENQFAGMFAQAAGEEVEMPDDEARRYIAKGLASEVKKPTK